jgi:hypothetical protein
MGILVLENFGILLDRGSAVEHTGLYLRHIFAESRVLILDLVCELTGMAHNQNGCLTSDRLNLLKCCQDEDSSLTETGLGLAEDIGSENSLRNANLLDCKMIEPMLDKCSSSFLNDVQGFAESVHHRSMTTTTKKNSI